MKTNIYKILLSFLVLLLPRALHAQQHVLPQQTDRWTIQPDGSIKWTIDGRLPHADHIEMSGEKVSVFRHGGTTIVWLVFKPFRSNLLKKSNRWQQEERAYWLPGPYRFNNSLF